MVSVLHTLQGQPPNYCQEAPSRSASLHLKALIWQNSPGAHSVSLSQSTSPQASITKLWHYGWFASFLKICSYFTQLQLKKTFITTPIETRQAVLVWVLEDIPNDCSACRSLVLWHLTQNNHSHRTSKDKTFSAFGLAIATCGKEQYQMGSIYFVSFYHLKILNHLLGSQMLSEKNGGWRSTSNKL